MSVFIKVIFITDWLYSKYITPSGEITPEGGGYCAYNLRYGKKWLTNESGAPAILEYCFVGATLILNGKKFTKM